MRFADWFRRPLRLTPPEGLALVAAARALLGVPGAGQRTGSTEDRGALASAVSKLEMVLGAGGEEALEVELGAASAEVLRTFQQAGSEQRKVRVDYYSFGRDEVGERVVRPWRLFSSGGHWYLLAWCEKVADKRLFRVDRVRSATLLDEQFEPPEDLGPVAVYEGKPDDPLVVLDVAPGAHWIVERYPNEGTDRHGRRAMCACACGPVPRRGWRGSCFGPGRTPRWSRARTGYYADAARRLLGVYGL